MHWSKLLFKLGWRDDVAFDKYRAAHARMVDAVNALITDGWRLVEVDAPEGLGRVVFTRDGNTTFVQSWDLLPPEYNISGLWWRPLRDEVDVTPEGSVNVPSRP